MPRGVLLATGTINFSELELFSSSSTRLSLSLEFRSILRVSRAITSFCIQRTGYIYLYVSAYSLSLSLSPTLYFPLSPLYFSRSLEFCSKMLSLLFSFHSCETDIRRSNLRKVGKLSKKSQIEKILESRLVSQVCRHRTRIFLHVKRQEFPELQRPKSTRAPFLPMALCRCSPSYTSRRQILPTQIRN